MTVYDFMYGSQESTSTEDIGPEALANPGGDALSREVLRSTE